MLKNGFSLLLLFVLSLLLMSCGSSDSPSVTGSGPENIQNALVCLDTNDNYICDDAEPSARSLTDGYYKLPISFSDASGYKVLFVVDGNSVDTSINSTPHDFYTMSSLTGKPELVSIFTTLLGSGLMSEDDFRVALGVSEDIQFFEAYDDESEIYPYAGYLTSSYTSAFQAATNGDMKDYKQAYNDVAGLILGSIADNPGMIAAHIEELNEPSSPPLPQVERNTVEVTDTIFQNIPIDAATMYFGVGMKEDSREILTGAYCFSTPQKDLAQNINKGPSQNTETYTFKLVESEKDLLEELNINGGFSLGMSNISGSIEGGMLNEFKQHSESIFALIKAEFVFDGYHLQGMQLAENFQGIDFSDSGQYGIFKKSCGDRYLHTVVTGGAYYGLLRISSTGSQSKDELRAKLKGKYGKAGIEVNVNGDFQKSVKESLENTSVSIKIGSRGVIPINTDPNSSELINDLDSFFNNADNFIRGVKNKDCQSGDEPWTECAYAATFASYEEGLVGGSQSQQQISNMRFVKKLMGLYESYESLRDEATEIYFHSHDYDWDTSSYDPRTKPISSLLAELDRNKKIIHDAYTNCGTDYDGCLTGDAAQKALSLKSTTEIYFDLPYKNNKLAENCSDIKRQMTESDTDDAKDVELYMSGDYDQYYLATCTGLQTSEPEAYLILFNTSGSTDSLSSNMSQYTNPDGSVVKTIYDKILVNINMNNLEIVNGQTEFQETVSNAVDNSTTADKNFEQADLGFAVDCYASGSKTNIDLEGTNLIFDDTVGYRTQTHPESKYEFVTNAMSWESAKEYAEGKGGYLAVFDNINEFEAVRSFRTGLDSAKYSAWVGLKRTDKVQQDPISQFQWITTGVHLTLKEVHDYFNPGEPNNYGKVEDCVHMWPATASFRLNDRACNTNLQSLIEYDSTVSPDAGAVTLSDTSLDIELTGDVQDICVETAPESGIIRLVFDSSLLQ